MTVPKNLALKPLGEQKVGIKSKAMGEMSAHVEKIPLTLPETNITPENRPDPERKFIFQPSIFISELLVSGRVITKLPSCSTHVEVRDGWSMIQGFLFYSKQILPPRPGKLTWLWKLTIWCCISYWKLGFDNVMLVFRGVCYCTLEIFHHLFRRKLGRVKDRFLSFYMFTWLKPYETQE